MFAFNDAKKTGKIMTIVGGQLVIPVPTGQEISDADQKELDKEEAERLMQIEADDITAKEAKKIVGLSQGVIDELTKKEK